LRRTVARAQPRRDLEQLRGGRLGARDDPPAADAGRRRLDGRLPEAPRDLTPEGRPMLRIDHVVLAVRDLDASAERLWGEHGLRFVAGGRHARWGTANMIAP